MSLRIWFGWYLFIVQHVQEFLFGLNLFDLVFDWCFGAMVVSLYLTGSAIIHNHRMRF